MVIRIATYNVHKCRGLDRRTRPDRIANVIRELDADIVALQEVLSMENGKGEDDQANFIAEQLGGYTSHFGENRRLRGGAYGNVTLSRLPVALVQNYDLTWKGRERRGCLRTDVVLPRVQDERSTVLHVFNVHLGTGFIERRHQARRLVSQNLLQLPELNGHKVVVGDFNEWTRGLATRLMAKQFESVDLRLHLRRRRSYPGLLPLLHLDHFYFDNGLKLERCALDRSRRALVASDHLPLVADFSIGEAQG